MLVFDPRVLRAVCDFVDAHPPILLGDLRLLADIADAGAEGLRLAELRERTADYGSYTRVTRALARLNLAGLVHEVYASRDAIRGRRTVLAYAATSTAQEIVAQEPPAQDPPAKKPAAKKPAAKKPAAPVEVAYSTANVYVEDGGCRDVF